MHSALAEALVQQTAGRLREVVQCWPGAAEPVTKHPRFVVHFTPTSASWLNPVERFFAEITEKRIRRGVFKTVKALEQAIEAYLAEHNANPKPFKWTATADLILRRVEELCKRTSDSGH